LDLLQGTGILVAGAAAGAINAAVGSGTLVTFPVLLAFGYSPLVANVSNTIGLVPGSAAGALGYRTELTGRNDRNVVIALAAASVTGAVVGALLLLVLPAAAFAVIVPAFIVLALGLILCQERLQARLAARGRPSLSGRATRTATFFSGVYGGYFGAAQGILLLAILGLSLEGDLQHVNAVKVVLAGLVNLVAGVVFICVAHVAWSAAILIAIGSTVGGLSGARVARRLPIEALRTLIVGVGIVAIVRLVS
jgi:uncharacterized membrane protein YfcA